MFILQAIMKGDKTTGVSIMKILPKHFDIGEVFTFILINN